MILTNQMLTAENYHSQEMNQKYMSGSQVKSFMDCEAGTLAEINGENPREETTALMVGKYVDAHFSKELDLFKAKNPQIFKKDMSLKADYAQAEYIIQRIERDPFFMKFLQGIEQPIFTGEIAGVPFKGKLDFLHEKKCIVDLKIMRDFAMQWKNGVKLNFIEFWKYDLQQSIYQKLERNKLPILIAAATKEKPEPDLEIISIPQERLDYCLQLVEQLAPRFQDIKLGKIEANRCGVCSFCKRTKVLSEVVSYEQIGA